MSKYAVMPLSDYDNACDKIKEKTETSELIKSGELANKVDEVYSAGVEAGKSQGGGGKPTLYGTYVIKEEAKGGDVASYEYFRGKGVYAYFYDPRIKEYQYLEIDYSFIGLVNEGLYWQTAPDENGIFLVTDCYFENNGWTAGITDTSTDSTEQISLPDTKGRIIVFTEPTEVSEDFYNLFTKNIDTEIDIFGEGEESGVAEGIEQGADVEKKRFWGILQDYGNRTNWTYAFYQWRVDIVDPQYDVRPQNATNMLQQVLAVDGKNLNIPEIEARNGIKFDFSKCTTMPNMIAWSAVEDLGFVDTTSCPNPSSTFSNNGNLKRLSIAIKEDGSQNFSGAFDYSSAIEELTVVSGYFGSNLNFQWATKLKKASFVSVISHLLDSASGLSVTFSKTACDKAFETASGANDGSASAEWLNLIATKPNWSIKLV